jgi:hypothetical protein
MRLNRKTLILLGGSVLIILGVLLFQDTVQATLIPPTETPVGQMLLPDDLAQQAIQMIIRQQADFTQIDKLNNSWQVTDGTAVDDSRETHSDFVDGLLGIMSGFNYISAFESDDLSQFGLDESMASIEIKTDTDDYLLQLGQINPDGDRIYVMLNDVSTVYLMPAVFEFSKVIELASAPPYRQIVVEETPELSDNLLFPDIFGYQITEFMIKDQRDGSFIRYIQGELGTWLVDGTIVNEELAINDVQAAVNVSQFLFLDIEPLATDVINSVTDVPILTLSMTTEDIKAYTMNVSVLNNAGYVGILDDGTEKNEYRLPTDTVNLFFDMVRYPPYADTNG